MGKRYYWLKLKEDFFRQLPIKKLRRIAGGDTYTIIYLKMMLVTTKTDGVIGYDGATDDDFIENLALDIDEDIANVEITCQFLLANGLMVPLEDGNMLLPEAASATGSEQASAQRVRDFRAREKAKALQCNTDVTSVKQISNGEIEIEKEIEKEIDISSSSSSSCKYLSKDEDGYNLFQDIERCLKMPITPYLAEQFMSLQEEVGIWALREALEESAKHGARSYAYVETVARKIASGGNTRSKAGALDFDALREKYKQELKDGN